MSEVGVQPTTAASSDQSRWTWPPPPMLVDAAQGADSHALERLLTLTYPKVAGFFAARGCDRDVAADLASEVLARVVEHLASLRDSSAYRTWLWRLSESVFREWLRATTKHKDLARRDLPSPPDTPDEAFEYTEEERRLREAFSSLETEDQRLLWMRYVEELSYRDISRARRRTENATRVAVHRAKLRLADLLAATA